MAGHDLVHIVFELEPDAWPGIATERMWAEPVGGGRYRLRNSPFFVFGVSAEDIVHAEERDGVLYFTKPSIHAGHSTYRLLLKVSRTSAEFDMYWDPIQALGCSYEEGRMLSVHVPATTDLNVVYSLFEAGEAAGAWEFEEGHVGHHLNAGT